MSKPFSKIVKINMSLPIMCVPNKLRVKFFSIKIKRVATYRPTSKMQTAKQVVFL